MRINFVRSAEKKKIVEKLNDSFGIEELPYLLIESGKEKLKAFSGHLSKEEMLEIAETIRIEAIGLYLVKEENNELRLGLDGAWLLKDQITKNIVEVNKEQAEMWMKGLDLDIKTERGPTVIKYKDYIIGCGKSSSEKIYNYVPKDRRVRNKLF